MKLTDRDIKIIKFIEVYKGATIEQIQKLFFLLMIWQGRDYKN
ncbi:hypothetical protein [Clostridium sp. SHJSY1]|nr:hypothetical protein [Clostridium sp. SHJSY1]